MDNAKTLKIAAIIAFFAGLMISMLVLNNCWKVRLTVAISNSSLKTCVCEYSRYNNFKNKEIDVEDNVITGKFTVNIRNFKMLNVRSKDVKSITLDKRPVESLENVNDTFVQVQKDKQLLFLIISVLPSLLLSLLAVLIFRNLSGVKKTILFFVNEKNHKFLIILFLCLFILNCLSINFNLYQQFWVDSFWAWALNFIEQTHSFTFGKDVFFTYGPLGFLAVPFISLKTMTLAYLCRLLFAGSILFSLYYSVFKYHIFDFKHSVILSGLGILFLCMPPFEWFLGVTIYFLLVQSLYWQTDKKKPLVILYSWIALLTAIGVFVKFTLTSVLFLTLLLYYILSLIFYKKHFKIFNYTFVPVFALSFLLLSCYFFTSVNDLINYLWGSFEVAKGFAPAMTIVGEKLCVFFAFCIIIIYFVQICSFRKTDKKLFLISLISLPLLFFMFKHGFVRQDKFHNANFFLAIPYVFGIIYLVNKNKKGAFAFFVLPLMISYCSMIAFCQSPGLVEKGFSTLKFAMPKQIKEMNKIHYEGLNAMILEEKAKDIIQNEKVEILPMSLQLIEANNLNASFNPIFQLYSAYTYKLDEISAQHYYTNQAPKFIVVEFSSIDTRNMFLDTPQTWNAIYNNYSIVYNDLKYFILQRNETLNQTKPDVTVKRGEIKFGENLYIQPNQEEYYRFNIEQTILGKIMTLLFRSAVINVEIGYTNGIYERRRIVADTLRFPIRLSYIPRNLDEAVFLFENKDKHLQNVLYIKFIQNGVCYKNNISIEKTTVDEK